MLCPLEMVLTEISKLNFITLYFAGKDRSCQVYSGQDVKNIIFVVVILS